MNKYIGNRHIVLVDDNGGFVIFPRELDYTISRHIDNKDEDFDLNLKFDKYSFSEQKPIKLEKAAGLRGYKYCNKMQFTLVAEGHRPLYLTIFKFFSRPMLASSNIMTNNWTHVI